MFVFKVIDNVFFDIPINDICIPGLHITLGVYLKLFRIFEYAVKQIDLQITGEVAILQHKITNEEFSLYIEKLKCVHVFEVEIAELEERREFALSQDDHFDEQAYDVYDAS